VGASKEGRIFIISPSFFSPFISAVLAQATTNFLFLPSPPPSRPRLVVFWVDAKVAGAQLKDPLPPTRPSDERTGVTFTGKFTGSVNFSGMKERKGRKVGRREEKSARAFGRK